MPAPVVSPGPPLRSAAARARSIRAFTLIELITLIVITGVLAAVAAPAVSGFGDSREALAARRLQADLTYARQRAVATSAVHWVELSVPNQSWEIAAEELDHPGRAGAAAMVDPLGAGEYRVHLGAAPFPGVGMSSADFDGTSAVGFDALGRPRNGHEADLAATGSVVFSGGAMVAVHAETGHVEVVNP